MRDGKVFLPFKSVSFGIGRTQERVLGGLGIQSPEKLGKQVRLGNEGSMEPYTGTRTAYFHISLKASSFLSCLSDVAQVIHWARQRALPTLFFFF